MMYKRVVSYGSDPFFGRQLRLCEGCYENGKNFVCFAQKNNCLSANFTNFAV